MRGVLGSQETLDWDGLMVVMALNIAKPSATPEPHVIEHYFTSFFEDFKNF
jgi:hypothetical protein